MKLSPQSIMNSLKRAGWVFDHFNLKLEQDAHPEDVIWNYRDHVHLGPAHKVPHTPVAADPDKAISINLQKILGIRLPIIVVDTDSGEFSQTSFTTLLCFVLIIENKCELIAEDKSCTTTSYHVGTTKWFSWCFPVIRWLLKKNYRYLMKEDVDIRARRAEIRKWGYRDLVRPDYESVMNIMSNNLIPPTGEPSYLSKQIRIASDLPEGKEVLLGRADHLGLRLLNKDGKIYAFPRMCSHEGASLDGEKCERGKVSCPWHARKFSPIAVIDLSLPSQMRTTSFHKFEFSDGLLKVSTQKPQSERRCSEPTHLKSLSV